MELPEKLESALAAYLQTGTYPTYFNPTTQIQPGESEVEKSGQVIICSCGDAEEEYPLNSGDFWHTVTIELRTPGKKTTNLDRHKAVAAVLEDLILVSDLEASLTASVSDFTCLGVLNRQPIREQTETYWATGWTMRCLSCSIAFA